MDEDLLEAVEDNDESDVEESSFDKSSNCTDHMPSTSTAEVMEQPILKQTKTRTLVPWTNQQKKIVRDFKNHIKEKRPPKRLECEELKTNHTEVLANKDWLKIKVFIQNEYTKKKKYED